MAGASPRMGLKLVGGLAPAGGGAECQKMVCGFLLHKRSGFECLARSPVPRNDPHELVQPSGLARTILKRR